MVDGFGNGTYMVDTTSESSTKAEEVLLGDSVAVPAFKEPLGHVGINGVFSATDQQQFVELAVARAVDEFRQEFRLELQASVAAEFAKIPRVGIALEDLEVALLEQRNLIDAAYSHQKSLVESRIAEADSKWADLLEMSISNKDAIAALKESLSQAALFPATVFASAPNQETIPASKPSSSPAALAPASVVSAAPPPTSGGGSEASVSLRETVARRARTCSPPEPSPPVPAPSPPTCHRKLALQKQGAIALGEAAVQDQLVQLEQMYHTHFAQAGQDLRADAAMRRDMSKAFEDIRSDLAQLAGDRAAASELSDFLRPLAALPERPAESLDAPPASPTPELARRSHVPETSHRSPPQNIVTMDTMPSPPVPEPAQRSLSQSRAKMDPMASPVPEPANRSVSQSRVQIVTMASPVSETSHRSVSQKPVNMDTMASPVPETGHRSLSQNRVMAPQVPEPSQRSLSQNRVHMDTMAEHAAQVLREDVATKLQIPRGLSNSRSVVLSPVSRAVPPTQQIPLARSRAAAAPQTPRGSFRARQPQAAAAVLGAAQPLNLAGVQRLASTGPARHVHQSPRQQERIQL